VTIGVAMASSGQDVAPTVDVPNPVSSRLAALALASSLDEVVSCVPMPYRTVSQAELRLLCELVEKLHGARASLRKLKSHKAAGTWPPQLAGLKPPVFQVTKSFEDATSPPQPAAIAARTSDFKKIVLDDAISMKSVEVSYYDRLTVPAAYLPKLCDAVENIWTTMVKTRYTSASIIAAASGIDAMDANAPGPDANPGDPDVWQCTDVTSCEKRQDSRLLFA
jgi:hypothetical protein